jgi:hypothetical protein
MKIRDNVVYVSPMDVTRFNHMWPGSTLRVMRGYRFEFDSGDLVDTSVPHSHDGPAALAMADDCAATLESGVMPEWSGK